MGKYFTKEIKTQQQQKKQTIKIVRNKTWDLPGPLAPQSDVISVIFKHAWIIKAGSLILVKNADIASKQTKPNL